MKDFVKSVRDVCSFLERILFTFGYWTFWAVWNFLGLKWLFRAVIAVIDQSDEEDSAKIVDRLRAIHRAGETV